VLQGLDNEIPSDLIAIDIRQSLHYLGLITGEITNEDQLDFIFRSFVLESDLPYTAQQGSSLQYTPCLS